MCLISAFTTAVHLIQKVFLKNKLWWKDLKDIVMAAHHFYLSLKTPPAPLRKITPTLDLASIFTVTFFNIIRFAIKTLPYYKSALILKPNAQKSG